MGVTSSIKDVANEGRGRGFPRQYIEGCFEVMLHTREYVCDNPVECLRGVEKSDIIDAVNVAALLYYARRHENEGDGGFEAATWWKLSHNQVPEHIIEVAKKASKALGAATVDGAEIKDAARDAFVKYTTIFCSHLIAAHGLCIEVPAREQLERVQKTVMSLVSA